MVEAPGGRPHVRWCAKRHGGKTAHIYEKLEEPTACWQYTEVL